MAEIQDNINTEISAQDELAESIKESERELEKFAKILESIVDDFDELDSLSISTYKTINSFSKSFDDINIGSSKLNKNLNTALKTALNLKKSLMSFDEMNILEDTNKFDLSSLLGLNFNSSNSNSSLSGAIESALTNVTSSTSSNTSWLSNVSEAINNVAKNIKVPSLLDLIMNNANNSSSSTQTKIEVIKPGSSSKTSSDISQLMKEAIRVTDTGTSTNNQTNKEYDVYDMAMAEMLRTGSESFENENGGRVVNWLKTVAKNEFNASKPSTQTYSPFTNTRVTDTGTSSKATLDMSSYYDNLTSFGSEDKSWMNNIPSGVSLFWGEQKPSLIVEEESKKSEKSLLELANTLGHTMVGINEDVNSNLLEVYDATMASLIKSGEDEYERVQRACQNNIDLADDTESSILKIQKTAMAQKSRAVQDCEDGLLAMREFYAADNQGKQNLVNSILMGNQNTWFAEMIADYAQYYDELEDQNKDYSDTTILVHDAMTHAISTNLATFASNAKSTMSEIVSQVQEIAATGFSSAFKTIYEIADTAPKEIENTIYNATKAQLIDSTKTKSTVNTNSQIYNDISSGISNVVSSISNWTSSVSAVVSSNSINKSTSKTANTNLITKGSSNRAFV